MLKQIILIAMVFVMVSVSQGLVVETDVPSSAIYYKNFDVTIDIQTEGSSEFDFVSVLPKDWEIVVWESNAGIVTQETRNTEYLGKESTIVRWNFQDIGDNVVLDYKIKPTSTGEHKIYSVWTFQGGFDSTENDISVDGKFDVRILVFLTLLTTLIILVGKMYLDKKKFNFFMG